MTGATGFVGSHLCRSLVDDGYLVIAVHTRRIPPFGWPEQIEWKRIAEIGPNTDWSEILRGGITHVVHLAAIVHRVYPTSDVGDEIYERTNHLGTAQLARAVMRTPSVQRFFFMSSVGAVTSLSSDVVNLKTPCNPNTAYGKSKLSAERAIQEILRETRVDWCIFRSPLIYGPGNPGNMGRLLKLLYWNIPLPFGSINNHRTFLYIGNLVDAILVALKHAGAVHQIFFVTDDEEVSTTELMRRLANAAGQPARLFSFPVIGLRFAGMLGDWLIALTGKSYGLDHQAIEKLCGSLSVDGSHFRESCQWKPPFTMEEGLRATIKAIV